MSVYMNRDNVKLYKFGAEVVKGSSPGEHILVKISVFIALMCSYDENVSLFMH